MLAVSSLPSPSGEKGFGDNRIASSGPAVSSVIGVLFDSAILPFQYSTLKIAVKTPFGAVDVSNNPFQIIEDGMEGVGVSYNLTRAPPLVMNGH